MSLTKYASLELLEAWRVPAKATPRGLSKAAHRVDFEYTPRPGYLAYCCHVRDSNKGKSCTGPGCLREAKCKGLCLAHYTQRRSGKDLSVIRVRAKNATDSCVFPGCDRPHFAKEYCKSHYHQRQRHGEVTVFRQFLEICSFPGCDRGHSAHGYCDGHAIQLRKGKELSPLRARQKGRVCTVDGCSDPYLARGFCAVHYNQWHWAESEEGREARKRAFHKRRAIKASAETRLISSREWKRLVNRYQGKCAYCRKAPWNHREHIIPLSRGGRESIGNLLPCCERCNTSKHNKLLSEWRYGASQVRIA
jgi:hypothetical protein